MNAGRPAVDAPVEAGPELATAGGILTIDLGALVANWRTLASLAAPAQCAAVVKADGYGIGLEAAVRALRDAGCKTFFVAHLSEALSARRVAPEAVVYGLNGLPPGAAPAYAEAAVRPVLGSEPEISEWAACCRTRGRRLPAAFHVDTGMNRLGLGLHEAAALAGSAELSAFEPALVMSHLVSSERPDDPVNARQIAAFDRVRSLFPGIPASLANSSGIFLAARPHFDLVRPGYALYGGNPTPGRPNPMRDVVRLEARIIQTRMIEPGAQAGYNAQWTAPSRRRLATVSVGYADGYPRAGSATDEKAVAGIPAAEVVIAGMRCPLAGRISMDLGIVDATEAPDDAVRPGALVTLIGDGLGIDEVGRRAGTIGYEILTGLGRRYHRRYLEPQR